MAENTRRDDYAIDSGLVYYSSNISDNSEAASIAADDIIGTNNTRKDS